MGNAPLAGPPRPTQHRVVMPISTKRKLGTKLSVFPLLHHNSANNATGSRRSVGTETSDMIVQSPTASTEAETVQEAESLDNNTGEPNHSASLPPQLEEGPISSEEYNAKLQQLEERLSQWKGGWATVALLVMALCLVLAFVAAYMIPAFWTSPLFDHPGYIGAIAIAVVAVFALLIRYTHKESQRLLQDVEDLYRPWRGRGVHVTMRHVANIGGGVYTTTPSGIRRRRQPGRTSGSNCFCVVMNVAHEDEEGGDAMSVGTVMTDDSRESGNEDDVDQEGTIAVIPAADSDVI